MALVLELGRGVVSVHLSGFSAASRTEIVRFLFVAFSVLGAVAADDDDDDDGAGTGVVGAAVAVDVMFVGGWSVLGRG